VSKLGRDLTPGTLDRSLTNKKTADPIAFIATGPAIKFYSNA
jgi:hypothetical protein